MLDRKYTIYLALGFEAAGLIVGFLYLGNMIDEKYHLRGMGVAGGALLGITLWIVHALLLLRSLEKQDETGQKPPQ